MSAQGYPVSLQKALISIEVNTTTLGIFLWGIYSAVYIGALHLYLSKKSSGNKLVIGAITLSYLAYSLIQIVFWYFDQSAVVNDSETRDTLAVALLQLVGPQWPIFVDDVMTFILAGVADGILTYRSGDATMSGAALHGGFLVHYFYSFVRSVCPKICVINVSFTTYNAIDIVPSQVIDFLIIILESTQHFDPTPNQGFIEDQLFSAQAFITFATTLLSTALIAYRIHRIPMEDIPRQSERKFKQITEILVQSAAVYSVAAITQAIPEVVPQTLKNTASLLAARGYTSVIFDFISGIAPTILVAQVAMLDDKDTYSSHNLSTPGSIQFRVQSTAQEASFLSEDSGRLATRSQGVNISDFNVNTKHEVSNV